jgi:hypothetical protein
MLLHKSIINHPIYKIFTVVKMLILVFFTATPCSLTGSYKHFTEEHTASIFKVGSGNMFLKIVVTTFLRIQGHTQYNHTGHHNYLHHRYDSLSTPATTVFIRHCRKYVKLNLSSKLLCINYDLFYGSELKCHMKD